MFATKHLRMLYKIWATNEELIIDGLPITARIDKTGGWDALQQANIKVSGLSMSHMEKMAVYELKRGEAVLNTITLQVKDGEIMDWCDVFIGNAVSALPRVNTDGTADFEIEAYCGYAMSIKEVPPTSVGEEPVSSVDLFAQFAKEGGIKFENRGTTPVMIKNAVFTGSPRDKSVQLASQIGVDWFVDLEIGIAQQFWKKDDSAKCPVVSKESGLIGYPQYNRWGVSFKCLFNRELKFGYPVELKCESIPSMNQQYQIFSMSHKLDAYLPKGGDWFTDIKGHYLGLDNPMGPGA